MDEKTPLLSAGSEAPRQSPNPGPFTSDAGLNEQPTIKCQVCGCLISIENSENRVVVKCPNCSEATPIKGPPPGKQFVRCPCNCLLICNISTTKVGCPRPTCQKVIVLHETVNNSVNQSDALSGGARGGIPDPYNPGGTFGTPPTLRVICGNCGSPFSVPTAAQSSIGSRQSKLISCLTCGASAGSAGLIAARCPRCRKLTSVGPAYARFRLSVYGLFTVLALILAVSVTVGTVESAKQNKALYFLWSVLYLIVLVPALRAVMYLVMPISSAEVPVLQL